MTQEISQPMKISSRIVTWIVLALLIITVVVIITRSGPQEELPPRVPEVETVYTPVPITPCEPDCGKN